VRAVHVASAIAGALVVALFGARPAAADFARTAQSDPFSGIHRETWRDPAIPARIHLVRIDLTSPEIQLVATKESERGKKTTQYLAAQTAAIAINGGPFAVAGFAPRGLAMGGAAVWSNTADDAATAVLHFRRQGEQTKLAIIPPEEVVLPGGLPAGTQGVLSGRPLLVRAGVAVPPPDCTDPIAIPCTRAPRTAAGVSADGHYLWLAVADGWQQVSLGVTAAELGAFLLARGAYMAVNLDGGGSATLAIATGVVNAPSDGVERAVANHLAIVHDPQTPGELTGFICKDTFSPCNTVIPGALVILDDGRMQTVGADGRYTFGNVTPRLACATAKKGGFRTNSRCSQVSAGQTQFNSIALMAGQDPVDAGVPDAAAAPEDAPAVGDGGPYPDGGMSGAGGGGCCDARSDRPPSWFVLLVAWAAFRRVRRRGTKT
jgi:hypothetical protein